MSHYRIDGHEGTYWVYPTSTPTPGGSRLDGAVGTLHHTYDGWIAVPYRKGGRIRGWAWRAPTRRQALAQLTAWLDTQ